MTWIIYKILQCVKDGENILIDKKIGFNPANLALAANESYDGTYEIKEDAEVIEKEPLGIAFGGTGATNAEDARKNLGIGTDIINKSGRIEIAYGTEDDAPFGSVVYKRFGNVIFLTGHISIYDIPASKFDNGNATFKLYFRDHIGGLEFPDANINMVEPYLCQITPLDDDVALNEISVGSFNLFNKDMLSVTVNVFLPKAVSSLDIAFNITYIV